MNKSSQSILFISDPVQNFNPETETTFFLMHEAARRGYAVWVSTPNELFMKGGEVFSRASRVTTRYEQGVFQFTIEETRIENLDAYQFAMIRKDPPVDQMYIYHLQMLTLLESGHTVRVINRPSGILAANEKMIMLKYAAYCTDTVITCDVEIFDAFLKDHGEIVLKPLNLAGGLGVYRLKKTDEAARDRFLSETKQGAEYVVLQRFIPEVQAGDKRILLAGEKILGAFLRVPAENDFRGNLCRGATLAPTTLTDRDYEIVETLLPTLRDLGLDFVGLDIIGKYLSEVNATSPRGIAEINRLYQKTVERDAFECFEREL